MIRIFFARKRFVIGLSVFFSFASFQSLQAIQFEPWEGVDGSFDTTLSLGTTIRVEDRAANLIGRRNGGTANSINYDQGDLNWGRGVTAFAAKANHELSLTGETMGFFGRVSYFYDFVNTNTNKINATAERYVGKDFDVLDLYVYKDLDAFLDRSSRIKVGNQVINWGESTFILNGLNSINPIDVSAFRVPGAEVKEALLPIPAIDFSIAMDESLSFEGFYQFAFEETELEAFGSYFSTNNFASPGGTTVFLGFGDPQIAPNRMQTAISTTATNPVANPILAAAGVPLAAQGLAPFGTWVPRIGDRKPSDQGEWGAAARLYSERFFDTEFGFYYTDLHSRLPLISANIASSFTGANSTTFANRSNYFLDFPSHIKTLGMSFATDLGATGISLAGEVSHKLNQPLQIHSIDLLQAALAPAAINGFAALEGAPLPPGSTVALTNIFNTNPIIAESGGISTASAGAAAVDSRRFLGTTIRGYKRKNVTQPQITITKLFGPFLKANQWVAVGEVGMVHVHGMPSRSQFRFDGPGLYLSGNPNFLGIGGMPAVQPLRDFPTKNSWGYRLVARFDYLDVYDGISLFPSIRFNHDVKGTTPNPLATFVEGRKAIGLNLRATYLEQLSAEVGYNHFFGAGARNLVRDRDFVSLTVRYSF